MSDPTSRVICQQHSETAATFVCHHLASGVGCGFHSSDEDAADPWPDAWCDLCEAAFQREGEWNDSNEPELSILCTTCYELARVRNETVPLSLASVLVAGTPSDYSKVAVEAFKHVKAGQEAAQRDWPAFGGAARWDYDHENRTISFSGTIGIDPVIADVTITGSYSTRSKTWMWAWENEGYTEDERAAVAPLKTFGEVRGIERFQQGHWPAEEIDGWELTQIAAVLLGADAIYRAPFEHVMVFMLLRNFRPARPDSDS